MATGPDPLTKRDAIVIGGLVIVSVTAQALAAAYFEMTGSLLALGGSALAFLIWVFVRFRPRT